jgi:hypothetical protein
VPFAIESLDGSANNPEQPDVRPVQPAVRAGRHGPLRRRRRGTR